MVTVRQKGKTAQLRIMKGKAPARQNQRELQRETTRTAILEAALSSFAEHGFAGSSTRSIAALGQVHHALIKYHFKNKETLWRAAVTFLFDRQAAELTPSVSQVTAATARGRRTFAREALRRYVQYCARHPEHARLMVQESVRDTPRLRWAADTYISGTAKAALNFVRVLKKEKVLPDVSDVALIYIIVGAAQLFYTLAPEVRYVWKVDPADPEVIESHIEAVLAVFLR